MGVIVFFIAGLVCIAGLCAAPVTLNIQGGVNLRLGVRYLWFSRNIEFALKRAFPKFAVTHNGTGGEYVRFFRRHMARYAARCASRHVRARRFRLKMEFSCGEAGSTALAYGLLCGVLRPLYLRINSCKPEITLSPRFLSGSALSFYCDIMLSVPALFLLRLPRFRFVTGINPHGRGLDPDVRL